MERFAIGQGPTLTKKEKDKYKQKQKRKRNQINTKTTYSPQAKILRWRILPCEVSYCFTIDIMKGNTFFTKMDDVEKFGDSFFHCKNRFLPNYKANTTFLEKLKKIKKDCKEILIKNQQLRWKFKRFVTMWRLKGMKRVNDTDFVTLSPIQTPVFVAMFPMKSCYTFEASSILQDIHKKLLHHDGQIPTPIFPRNPYTNQPFTVFQVASIQKQCKEKGKSSWAFECFAKSKYTLHRFLQYERKMLRFHAIKSLLSNLSDWYGHDLLLNFIESQHEEHDIPFQKLVYRWSIHTIPNEERIKKWTDLCREYHESDILAEDQNDRDLAYFIAADKSLGLCSPPSELLAKHTLFLQMNKDGTRNRFV